MIAEVKNQKQLETFIKFVLSLYKQDTTFVPPIFSSLTKELKQKVLNDKTYTALINEDNGEVKGRILYTISKSKSKNCDIGFFSFFDCINSQQVCNELFEYMEKDLKQKGIKYIEGTFCPYDPDTRRGILVKGFDKPHTILTSYNFDYYSTLLEQYGFKKAYDTYTMDLPLTNEVLERTKKIHDRFLSNHNVTIESFNSHHPEKDVDDIYQIFQVATTQLNYQEPPSKQMIENVAKSLKFLIQPSLIKIAREKDSGAPVGFCFLLPDYNQVFKKTHGKVNIIKLLIGKSKITSARGSLQYITPKYQNSGLLYAIYHDLLKSMKKLNISTFEGGTILEENTDSWHPFESLGGSISKIYRIYGRKI